MRKGRRNAIDTKATHVRQETGTLSREEQLELFQLPRRREFLVRYLPPLPARVLDVGCASGYIAALVAELGYDVVGVELNEAMAAQARARGIEVVEHDLENGLPFEDQSFDLVHACEVIEHLYDTEGFLRETHRVLQPHGSLILSTPNLNGLANRLRVLAGKPLPMWGAYPDDGNGTHIRVLNLAKATELLARTGFRVGQVQGASWHRLAGLIDRRPTLSTLLLFHAVKADPRGARAA